jgi:hypothetical protein
LLVLIELSTKGLVMNRQEKQALAQVIITHIADLTEDWEMQMESSPQGEILKNVDGREIAQAIANWLQHLPGNGWDARLPMPAPVNNRKEAS